MSDVDDIRQQMALIRHDMHHDVSSVVTEVGEAMDWRAVIRNHPYIALLLGLAVGYLLVPRRKKSTAQQVGQVLAEVPPRQLAALAAVAPGAAFPAAEKPQKSIARRLVGWGVGMLWPLVSQSAQAYAAIWLENQLKQQLTPRAPGGYVPPSSSGRPGESYDDGPYSRAARRG